MINKFLSPELSFQEQLYQLTYLRTFYVVGEILAIVISQYYFEVQLNWVGLWLVGVLHIFVVGSLFFIGQRYNNQQQQILISANLLDLILFSLALWLAEGVSNGLVSILLLPVATSAALFTMRTSFAIALMAIFAYSLLSWLNIQSTGIAHHHGEDFSTHLIGMWLSFIFSCLLIVWFIAKQAEIVRSKEASLSALREKQIRDEQVVAIATFAANAAHDLGTPLSSISLICDELVEECLNDNNEETLNTLIDQIERCREIVQSINHKAISAKSSSQQQILISDYFNELITHWLVSRPDIMAPVDDQLALSTLTFQPDISLEAAITNILDNAAAASLKNNNNFIHIHLSAINNSCKIQLIIQDHGEGIPDELINKLGKEPVASRRNGLGLGQFLANVTIERNGGEVWRENTKQGARTYILINLLPTE